MRRLFIIIAISFMAIFGATYNVTPTQLNWTTDLNITFTPNDTSWQLQAVVDNYHIGGATYGKTYWGTTYNSMTGAGDIRYYYWCGGTGIWCFKIVHTLTGINRHATLYLTNNILYAYISRSINPELMVNYTDTLWRNDTVSASGFVACKGALYYPSSGSMMKYDTSNTITTVRTGLSGTFYNQKDMIWIKTGGFTPYIYCYDVAKDTMIATGKPASSRNLFSPGDTSFYSQSSGRFTNGIDTINYAYTDGFRNLPQQIFADFEFSLVYAKNIVQVNWTNKQVFTYTLPESATSKVYMPSKDTVYYGHGNINKLLVYYVDTKTETASSSGMYVNCSPNPFNPSTIINFKVNQTSKVKIAIYSINGDLVKTLVNGLVSSGKHSVEFKGIHSGIYICKAVVGNYKRSFKMMMVR